MFFEVPVQETAVAVSPDVWNMVTAIATGIQAIVVIIAAVFAFYQVREANRARRDAVALALIERLNDVEAAQRRRRVYSLSRSRCCARASSN